MFKSLLLSFTMLLAAMLGGCQTYYGFAKYVSDDRLDGKNVLMSHPSPLVSLPTLLGDVVGVVVALPLEIPASFIAGGYNAVKDRTDDAKYAKELNETEHEKYVRLAPAIVLEAVGQHALGVPAWMMFGWWWPKDLIVIPRPAQDTKVAATSPKASEAFRADAPLPAASAPDQPVMAYGGGYVGALAFSPDGKTCAIGRGKYLLLIDAASGRCLRVLGGHEGMVAGAVFSNDGSKIATSAFDTADEDQVTSYSKNRKLDFTARLWNVSDGRCLRVFAGHTKSVVGLAISADGSRIVTGSDDSSAKLWDAENGKCLLTLTGHEHGIGSVAIAPDGNTILTGSGDHTARLWDAKSGRCLQVLTGHEGPIYSVAFSPDGQRVLTGSPDRTARVWDTRTGKELFKLNCGSLFKSRIRTGTDDFFGPLPTTDMVLSVAFTLDGASILTGISSGTSIVWSAADGKRLREIKSKIEENVAQRKSPGVCRTVVFSRDGSKIMTGALDGLVRLWDAQTEKCIQIFGGHGDNEIRAMALSPDGKTLATGSYFCTTCLWNIADGRCTKSLKFMDRGPGWEVGGVAFSPGGARIFTACNDGYFRIWQVSDGKQLGRFRGAGGNGYRSAAGTADGKLAVVGDGNQTAHLIDLEQEKTYPELCAGRTTKRSGYACGHLVRSFTGAFIIFHQFQRLGKALECRDRRMREVVRLGRRGNIGCWFLGRWHDVLYRLGRDQGAALADT